MIWVTSVVLAKTSLESPLLLNYKKDVYVLYGPALLHEQKDLTTAIIVAKFSIHKCTQISNTVNFSFFNLDGSQRKVLSKTESIDVSTYILHSTEDVLARFFVLGLLYPKLFLHPKIFFFGLLHLGK